MHPKQTRFFSLLKYKRISFINRLVESLFGMFQGSEVFLEWKRGGLAYWWFGIRIGIYTPKK